MTTPHKCPVCEGRGLMPYEDDTLRYRRCHACSKGIVWESEQLPPTLSYTVRTTPGGQMKPMYPQDQLFPKPTPPDDVYYGDGGVTR